MKNILKTFIPNNLQDIFIFIRYIIFRYIINKNINRIYLSENVKIKLVDNSGNVTFFGYYNITPQNKINVLYLSTKRESLRGSVNEPCKIKIYDIKTNHSVAIETTKSWNWQQGSMAQWCNYSSQDCIIFNDYCKIKDAYYSKIIQANGNLIRKFQKPVYSVNSKKNIALTLNFDRLTKLRPDYGYFNKKNIVLPNNKNDGIWLIDLLSGKDKLLLTLEDLVELSPTKSMEGAIHKVNHIDINQCGERFIFLHRWISKHGRFTRLLSANVDGSEVSILNGDKMTSHCCWLDNHFILAYCTVEEKGTGYFKIEDSTADKKLFSENMPKRDGHPSISPDKQWIITDTYPDLSRFSNLYLYSLKKDELILIGKFYQSLKYRKEMRIDLHPKWSPDGNSIFIESGHLGKRSLFAINVKNIVNDEIIC